MTEPQPTAQTTLVMSYEHTTGQDMGDSIIPDEECVVQMKLHGDDLESIAFVMRKVETFLQRIGFDYVTLRQADETDFGKWVYDNPVGHSIN